MEQISLPLDLRYSSWSSRSRASCRFWELEGWGFMVAAGAIEGSKMSEAQYSVTFLPRMLDVSVHTL